MDANKATVLSSIGDENTYITLSVRRLGSSIELVTVMTSYSPLAGTYLTADLARELAEDEDVAIAIATDLEYAAQDELRVMDIDFYKEPCGFPEALEKHFDNARYAAALAAE
ncbi:hypothetical protein SAE02_62850 [Skermanella aerolata]|uniref:Uncharacterized protein n=1 Tax=Skermanella aerolata TaxID=393310 RepID=A0A512E083_9PROT|nr:hypothetical protein [Skermanella aerolata]KJB91365.1 hypothetical protein N826_30875 [Skermanella aerolata KACC 11604]GEO42137.1 hypothetical protein SAE02_62850 [Skermanella aerolata]